MLRALVLLSALLPGLATAEPRDWTLDPSTLILVDVDWTGGRVTMAFPEFDGRIRFDERDPSATEAEITVQAASVETGFAPANAFAREPGYLDAARHPEITFRLTGLQQTGPSTADVFGAITFRGVTEPMTLRAEVFRYGPAADDPGRFEAGFNLAGAIDRTRFGSTGGRGLVQDVLPVRIRLLMTAELP